MRLVGIPKKQDWRYLRNVTGLACIVKRIVTEVSDVLRPNITMDDAVSVQERNCFEYLLGDVCVVL